LIIGDLYIEFPNVYPVFDEELACDNLQNLNTKATCSFRERSLIVVNALPFQNNLVPVELTIKNVKPCSKINKFLGN